MIKYIRIPTLPILRLCHTDNDLVPLKSHIIVSARRIS